MFLKKERRKRRKAKEIKCKFVKKLQRKVMITQPRNKNQPQ